MKSDLLADVHAVVAHPLQRPRRQHHRHRPLATVGVVDADLQRHGGKRAVEVVDDVVLAHQVTRHVDVAVLEGALGLGDQAWRTCLPMVRIRFSISSSAGGSCPVRGISLQMFTH